MKRFSTVWMCIALAVAAGLFAVPLAAQEDAAPDVFGEVIDVRVVNVEAVVVDKDGVRVNGLQPEDFRLIVDGEEVPIGYFAEVRGGEAVAAARPTEGGEAVPAIPATVPGESVGTSYLVFIDDYFSLERDRDKVLDGLIADLPSLGPNDRMAIVAFDGKRVEMLSSWNQNVPTLERAFRAAQERKAGGLQRLAERRGQEIPLAGLRSSRPEIGGLTATDLRVEERGYARQLSNQVDRSVSAAVATLRGFAQPPGRKVMLLLSGGWPYSPEAFVVNDPTRPLTTSDTTQGPELLAPLTDTANLLGFTVYPVDVPGLGDASSADVSEGGQLLTVRSGRVLRQQPSDLDIDSSLINSVEREQVVQASLHRIADATGGRALINSQKIDALAETVADTRSYYWLGFSPDRQRDDVRHDIRVEVKRKGYKVRSRGGFLDLSRQAETEMAVESALLFDDPAALGPLRVVVGEMTIAGRKYVEVPLRIAIPVDGITAVPFDGSYVAKLELRVAALDDSNRQSDIPAVPIELKLRNEPRSGTAVPYDARLKLRRQKQVLVVSLHDAVSGRNLSTRVEVDPRSAR
ncbi:MAG: VWA domain-containing protein [Acidobacteriota bacterium]